MRFITFVLFSRRCHFRLSSNSGCETPPGPPVPSDPSPPPARRRLAGVRFLVRQKPEKSEKKRVVNTSIARLCVCGVLLVTALAVSVACHVIEYGGRQQQQEDVLDYLL